MTWPTPEADQDVLALTTAEGMAKYGVTEYQWRGRRRTLQRRGHTVTAYRRGVVDQPPPAPAAPWLDDKKIGEFNWREANSVIGQVKELKERASCSQDTAAITFDVDHPIAFICLSDTHIGSLATDHDHFERITDEILQTPNLYVALLGDLQNMAIKLRGVLEVKDDVLPPDLQHRYIESWLEEISPRVLFSTWDNHSVMREESQSGTSVYAELMKRRVIYHSGIGHPDIIVGDQTYKIAAAHFFRGRSIENPCHGLMRYMRREGLDREIAIAGDSHVPGLIRYVDGGKWRLAANCGTLQTKSGYGRRFFGLYAQPVFPVIELWPDRHQFVGHWNMSEYKTSGLRDAA